MPEIDGRHVVVFKEKHEKKFYSGRAGWKAIAKVVFKERAENGEYEVDAPVEPTPPVAPPEGADEIYREQYGRLWRKYRIAKDLFDSEQEAYGLLQLALEGDEASQVAVVEQRADFEYEGFAVIKMVDLAPRVILPAPTERLRGILWTDADVLCLDHGLQELVTTDPNATQARALEKLGNLPGQMKTALIDALKTLGADLVAEPDKGLVVALEKVLDLADHLYDLHSEAHGDWTEAEEAVLNEAREAIAKVAGRSES